MNTKYIAIAAVVLATTFAVGRFSVSKKIEIKEVEKIVYQEKIVKDKEIARHKTSTTTKSPDGTETTTTTEDTKLDTHSDTQTDIAKDTEKSRIETPMNIGMRFDVLAGLDVTNPAGGYLFGVHVSKQLIGPINFGIWALTNKTVGISAGLQY